MSRKKPEEGDVIRYSFLWKHEAKRGQEEGRKDRPCAVVLSQKNDRIIVAPITHTPPKGSEGMELAPRLKKQLGLDNEKSWLITNEVNHFKWPDLDTRLTPDGKQTYGQLPKGMVLQAQERIRENSRDRSLNLVNRDAPLSKRPEQGEQNQNNERERRKIKIKEKLRQEREQSQEREKDR